MFISMTHWSVIICVMEIFSEFTEFWDAEHKWLAIILGFGSVLVGLFKIEGMPRLRALEVTLRGVLEVGVEDEQSLQRVRCEYKRVIAEILARRTVGSGQLVLGGVLVLAGGFYPVMVVPGYDRDQSWPFIVFTIWLGMIATVGFGFVFTFVARRKAAALAFFRGVSVEEVEMSEGKSWVWGQSGSLIPAVPLGMGLSLSIAGLGVGAVVEPGGTAEVLFLIGGVLLFIGAFLAHFTEKSRSAFGSCCGINLLKAGFSAPMSR